MDMFSARAGSATGIASDGVLERARLALALW